MRIRTRPWGVGVTIGHALSEGRAETGETLCKPVLLPFNGWEYDRRFPPEGKPTSDEAPAYTRLLNLWFSNFTLLPVELQEGKRVSNHRRVVIKWPQRTPPGGMIPLDPYVNTIDIVRRNGGEPDA